MDKLGGGGLLVVGVFFILLGWFIRSGILEWLLDIVGLIIIVAGIAAGIVGLVKMFSGSKSGASDF